MLRLFLRFFKLAHADTSAGDDNGATAAAHEARLQSKLRALRAQDGTTQSQLEEAVAGRPRADGHYMTVLSEMADTEVYHLNINCADVAHFNEECGSLYEVSPRWCTAPGTHTSISSALSHFAAIGQVPR